MRVLQNSSHPGRGFTLVEMLVVIGIIVLLAGLLLPTLTGARQASANAKCLNNLRQIGMAFSAYLNEYEQMLPGGRATNTGDDLAGPRGTFDPDEADLNEVVGDQLDRYLRQDVRVWRCPSARVVRTDPGFRAPGVVEGGLRPGDPDYTRVRDMFDSGGAWRPGYMYISTRAWRGFEKLRPDLWTKYWMDDWMGRNVAGLKTNQLNTITMQSASEIVLCLDYSSRYHSPKAVDDVYDVEQTATNFNNIASSLVRRAKYSSNFLYLDGHVDTKRYEWVGGLLNVLHKPIKQRWGNVNWNVKYPAGYTNTYPD